MTPPAAPPPVRPRRSRARTILPPAIAAWLLLEIWLLMTVAEKAGGLTVLGLLVAGAVVGAAVVKRAGRSAWRGLTAAARARASGSGEADGERTETEPKTEPKNAVPAVLGGLLLMMPGLVSDVAGLLCLFPPTRALLGRAFLRALKRPRSYEAGAFGDLLAQARMHRPDGKTIRGEVVEDDQGAGGRGADSGATGPEARPAIRPDTRSATRPDTRKNPGPQR